MAVAPMRGLASTFGRSEGQEGSQNARGCFGRKIGSAAGQREEQDASQKVQDRSDGVCRSAKRWLGQVVEEVVEEVELWLVVPRKERQTIDAWIDWRQEHLPSPCRLLRPCSKAELAAARGFPQRSPTSPCRPSPTCRHAESPSRHRRTHRSDKRWPSPPGDGLGAAVEVEAGTAWCARYYPRPWPRLRHRCVAEGHWQLAETLLAHFGWLEMSLLSLEVVKSEKLAEMLLAVWKERAAAWGKESAAAVRQTATVVEEEEEEGMADVVAEMASEVEEEDVAAAVEERRAVVEEIASAVQGEAMTAVEKVMASSAEEMEAMAAAEEMASSVEEVEEMAAAV